MRKFRHSMCGKNAHSFAHREMRASEGIFEAVGKATDTATEGTMAEQKADTPQTEGQQTRGGRGSSRGTSGGASGDSAQSAQQPTDQERQRGVSREPAATT